MTDQFALVTICRRALDTWGAEAQIDQCIEECAELTVELQHRKRGRPEHVAEEIADAIIVLHQMRLLIGVEAVDTMVCEKLARLEKRLEGAEG
ncbi:hypothetical protein [Solidesulfovibrio sp.]|uniref:hypothetical protein n=1 Tax=Solidesulfovibrio sp. TaxID=2910990 RepID=UPI002613D672|nr:hypothetical protein [Solidesulfovibrio sp.]